jgi:cytochrome c-type biogenesis protein CcmH/NrfG
MKMILTGVLQVAGAILVGLYFCLAIFFRVNAERRSANRQASQRDSASSEKAAVIQEMKAQAGK